MSNQTFELSFVLVGVVTIFFVPNSWSKEKHKRETLIWSYFAQDGEHSRIKSVCLEWVRGLSQNSGIGYEVGGGSNKVLILMTLVKGGMGESGSKAKIK